MASADRLIEIFHEAKARSSGIQREAFLAEACRDDPELQARVIALLQAEGRAGGFLQSQPQFSIEIEAELARLKPEEAGGRIGPYQLREQIGEGGFGVVWVAEQQEPVRRTVALKIIKMGMDTREVVARFEQERQALAMMDHPNIAKVFDASATEHGRPFFVMELVRGIKITDYCDQANLPTTERLALFIQVCHAVQHAHQKGIIHRDLKPSNILVTLQDGVAVPKVIDFGVAKATQGRLGDFSIYTQFQQMIGTPLYMSPEQAEMSGLDVDTRSDIYSLGVLLYELLTGRTPFDADALRKAGHDEMRRIIREQEPQKPSTALDTMAPATLTSVAHHHSSEPPKLLHAIRGDLDWIVMKTLEKDRSRRYDTTNGLALDIQRHLDNEPVLARPPSAAYRFQKWSQRNKLVVSAGASVAAALVLGAIASSLQAFRATQAEHEQSRLRAKAEANEQKAEAEAVKSQQVAQFMKDMLKGVGPSVALGRDTTMLREILDQTTKRIAEDLKNQPDVEAELKSTIGTVYWELGEFNVAAAMHRQAVAILRKTHGNENLSVALSLLKLGEALRHQGNLDEAEAVFRDSLATRRKLLGNEHPDVVQSLNHLGSLLSIHLNTDEPEALLREALTTGRKVLGNWHRDVATSLDDLGHVLNRRGKADEALAMHNEALAIRKKLFGTRHPDLIYSYLNIAQALEAQRNPAEAETMIREAMSICHQLLGERHPTIPLLRSELKRLLASQGKPEESGSLQTGPPLSVQSPTLAAQRNVVGERDPDAAGSVQAEADLLRSQGKMTEAEDRFREAIILFKKWARRDPRQNERLVQLGHCQWKLGQLLGDLGRHEDAERVFLEALQVFEQGARDFQNEPFMRQEQAFSRRFLAQTADAAGQVDEAESQLRAAIDLYAALAVEAPHEVLYPREEAFTTSILAEMLERANRVDTAATEFRKAVLLEKRAILNFPTNKDFRGYLVRALDGLARLLAAQGKTDEAQEMAREAEALTKEISGK
jgi:serine/threonine protein kinase